MRTPILGLLLLMIAGQVTAKDYVHKGIADLKREGFKTSIPLEGEWEFYWKEIIYRGGFKKYEPEYFRYPGLWNGQEVGDHKLSSKGYATYRLHMILPDSMEFTMRVEDMYCAFSLYLNGKLIARNGNVANNSDSYIPEWKPVFVPIQSLRDTNELILQIANFDHSKGGALEGIWIGDRKEMESEEINSIAYDLLLTGCLLMGGLFFIGLYFFGRHDKAIFYFSLFCISYSYRIIGFGSYILHSLIDISWYIAIRLEYITLFLCAFLFGKFIQHLYPGETRRIIWDIINTICWLCIGVTLLFSPSIFTHLVEPFFFVLLIYFFITLWVYFRAHRHKRPGATYALISTAIVFSVFFYNIMVYFGAFGDYPAVSFWGYILFFFSQSLILSFRFAYSLKKAKEEAEIASQAKSDFLSTISHEIRTPLNAVVGISHYMLQENPRKDQVENLSSLKYSAEHLTSLINDILDYNKLESGSVEFEEMDVDLKEMAESIRNGYTAKAREKGLEIKLDFDERIVAGVMTDRTRLNQILNNLIDNAIKFTQQGSVTLRIQYVSSSAKTITVCYEIEDTGIGIPEDKVGSVFERFTQASSSTTREFGGTGLGLSIIKRLLELQGVEIKVKSELGKGSTFYFEQRYRKGNAHFVRPVSLDEGDLEKKLEGRSVLLVEDNPMNVMVAEKFLKRWKMNIDNAENGQVAVDKVAHNYYDVILMDLQMPVMDGYKATMEIRGTKNPVPIIALTASALLKVQEKVMLVGMNDYITKPFDPKELIRKLAKNIRD